MEDLHWISSVNWKRNNTEIGVLFWGIIWLTILNTKQTCHKLKEQIPCVLVVFLTIIIYYLMLINCQLINLSLFSFSVFLFCLFLEPYNFNLSVCFFMTIACSRFQFPSQYLNVLHCYKNFLLSSKSSHKLYCNMITIIIFISCICVSWYFLR